MSKTLTNNAPPEVGATLQRLRLARGLTLEDLSRIAGVSKSMLSQIEREKANPTIAITWRLANALGVEIGELLSSEVRAVDLIRVVDPHETPTLPGAHAGYSLRILGPMDLAGKYEWYELTLAPGGEMASQAHDPGTKEHLTVITGTIELEVDPIDLEHRQRFWKPRKTNYGSGAIWKFAELVGPASEGAVTHPGPAGETHVYADL